ncbi:cation diffusion facilitator family transporter [Rhodovulum sp. DZ06]|uniref:cation diffusion facilitator family transporter n=1 Tax=Rhodovulum sp. DZ06 TaxID=3425126 RepID=UPI003D345D95
MASPAPLPPERAARINRAAGAAAVSTATLLVALKLWAFVDTGALSIAASLADSALDLLASMAGLVAVIYAARPPDEDHAFGHTSAEDLAALGQAAMVSISALAIGAGAVSRLSMDEGAPPLESEGVGIAVMAVSMALTGALILLQGWAAKRTGSKVIAADRLHYLGDLLPNAGALAALAVSARWGIGHVDAVVALAAAIGLLLGAGKIGAGAWHALMDRAADPDVVARIAEICDGIEGLAGWHDLKTRTSGARLFIQIHVEIDGRLTLDEAHERGERLRRAVEGALPNAEVLVHKDPV